MKQYTNESQTARLIELGFEKPKSIEKVTYIEQYGCGYEAAYSIGELIEMLPQEINNDALPDRLETYIDHNKMWTVEYNNILGALFSTYRTELIDALYDMILRLKEKGLI